MRAAAVLDFLLLFECRDVEKCSRSSLSEEKWNWFLCVYYADDGYLHILLEELKDLVDKLKTIGAILGISFKIPKVGIQGWNATVLQHHPMAIDWNVSLSFHLGHCHLHRY